MKPSNILITTFGTPVLADFGISSSLQRATADEVLAMSIPWSAPEVVAEQTAGTVASEVWSLGATVYSLLAGHSPFERRERGQNTKEQLRRRIARASYTDIARTDVPASLQTVLATAMSRDPARRYASAREFAEALRDVQSELGLSPTPLEIPDDEWSGASGPVDFGDTGLRGPGALAPRARRSPQDPPRARASRPSPATRTPSSRRPSPTRRRALPWILGGHRGRRRLRSRRSSSTLFATGVL